MAINIAGATTGIGQEVETATRSARVTLRNVDVGALGSYQKAMRSGLMAAAFTAGTICFSARWAPTPTTTLALVRRIVISAANGATAFTAGIVAFDAFVARAFTAADTTGTAGTFTTNMGKLRTSYATSAGMTCLIATTGALTAGTRTLDTDPFGTVLQSVPNTAGTPMLVPTEIFRAVPGEAPLVLANQEGFVIAATVPATGTWSFGVSFAWDELASYSG